METTIQEEIAAYESLRPNLETDHMGMWVLIRNRELVSLFDSFDAAAEEAIKKFGRGPYLIRQIGAPPMSLPASVMFHPEYAKHKLRV